MRRRWADPAERAARSAAIRTTLTSPEHRQQRDWLTVDQLEQIFNQYRRGDRIADIASNWLICTSHLYYLLRLHNVDRPKALGAPRERISPEQREQILARFRSGDAVTQIARDAHVSAASVYRLAKAHHAHRPEQPQ